MDLQESLANSIIAGTGLKIIIAYLAPNDDLGLVPSPGSHVIDEDFAGNQDWQYNYAVTVRTKDSEFAKQKLFAIGNYLNSLTNLESNTNSFLFQKIEVSSAPAEILQDLSGEVMYALDIAVLVSTNKYLKEGN
ncbi:minor capsid protein [Latilactobacillus sakei]